MPLRCEKIEDKSAIATIIARTYQSEGALTIEQTGVLRSLDSYDNNLSFVSDDGQVKAFALYTPVKVDGVSGSVVLAPFAFDIKDASFDVISFLKGTFKKLTEKGLRYIFVMGKIDDLSSLGFVFADDLSFSLVGNPPVSLLVKDLGEGTKLEGHVALPGILLS